MKQIISAIFILLCSSQVFALGGLDSIQKTFEKRRVIISNVVGSQSVENDFHNYNVITSHSTLKRSYPVFVEDTTLKKVLDRYNYHFLKKVTYNLVDFEEACDFSLAHFYGPFALKNCVLKGKGRFMWGAFYEKANIIRTYFQEEVEFIRTRFEKPVTFNYCRFLASVDFYGAYFGDMSNFARCNFYKGGKFSFTKFEGDVNFSNASFKGPAAFHHSQFKGELNFNKTRFDSIADFSNCDFQNKVLFSSVILPKYLDFSDNPNIDYEIDLTKVEHDKRYPICYINLLNTDLDKIKLYYGDFRLWFPENTKFEDKCAVYEGLLNNFKKNGFKDSYRDLDIAYQQFKYRHKDSRLLNRVQLHWWNYGYNKELIFTWLLRIAITLTMINALVIKGLVQRVYQIPFIDNAAIIERSQLHHPIIAYFLNLPSAFIYTVILLLGGAFGMKFDSSQIQLPGFFGLLYIISIGIMGIGCSAFLLNFIFDM